MRHFMNEAHKGPTEPATMLPYDWPDYLNPFYWLATLFSLMLKKGYIDHAVAMTDYMMRYNLHFVPENVTVELVKQKKTDDAVALCLHAIKNHRPDLVQNLALHLLKSGKVATLSTVTVALSKATQRENYSEQELATMFAPVVISAVEQNLLKELGRLQVALGAAHRTCILMWVVLHLVETNRVEIAVEPTKTTIFEVSGGPNVIAEVSAQLIAQGHCIPAGKLAKQLYDSIANEKDRIKSACVMGAACIRAQDRGHLEDVLCLNYTLFSLGCPAALADSVTCMVKYLDRIDAVAVMTWHAVETGRGDMIEACSEELLVKGRVDDVAVVNEATYSLAADKGKFCDVSAAAMIAAADKGRVGTLVQVNKALWEKGCLELLRDTVLALDRAGRPDVSGKIAWKALKSGLTPMVVDMSASVVRANAIQQAASVLVQLNKLSSSSSSVSNAHIVGDAGASSGTPDNSKSNINDITPPASPAIRDTKAIPRTPPYTVTATTSNNNTNNESVYSSSTAAQGQPTATATNKRVLDAAAKACMRVIHIGVDEGRRQVAALTEELLLRGEKRLVADLVAKLDEQGKGFYDVLIKLNVCCQPTQIKEALTFLLAKQQAGYAEALAEVGIVGTVHGRQVTMVPRLTKALIDEGKSNEVATVAKGGVRVLFRKMGKALGKMAVT